MEELNDKDARLKRETTRAKRELQRERKKKEEARLTPPNESKKQRNHREEKKNTWKSKYYRAIAKIEKVDPVMSSVQETMRKGPKAVRRKLIEGEVLKSQIIQNKKRLTDKSQKSLHAQVVAGPLIKEYGCTNDRSKVVSKYHQRKFRSHDSGIVQERQNVAKNTKTLWIRNTIREFLERDENSIVAPGSRETVTKKGETRRKRYVTDSLRNLHKKFLREESSIISRSCSYKFKPFW
ncbi:hypothetical protein QAD02_014133 [Eretmocerus hayati]|uniref:Uncharacterized protein n=1 Tax=Eretmocerus hayati TaxID=131215 RepID=A0ACC2P5N3_9HYME|nr:hypothetical protein QAD02_014133 [Eretmocerus hayati]